MAITITNEGEISTGRNDLEINDVEIQNDIDTRNPFIAKVEDEEAREAQALEVRRNEFLTTTDKDLREFDKYNPAEREAVRKQTLIRNILDAEHNIQPSTSDSYQFARAKVSKEMFGESLDDDAFFGKLQERAQTRKTRSDFQGDLVKNAILDSISGGANPHKDWNAKNANHEGREQFKDSRYLDDWNKAQEKIQERYGRVLPIVQEMFHHIESDVSERTIDDYYDDLSDEERPIAIGLLKSAARALSPDNKAEFFSNLKKQTARGSEAFVDNLINGIDIVAGLLAQSSEGHQAHSALRGENPLEENEKRELEIRKRAGFKDDLRRVEAEDYDPIKHLFEEGTFRGSVERGAYAAPNAIQSSVIAATPVIGQAAIIATMEQSSFLEYRRRFMEAGMTEGEAIDKASDISIVSGAVQGVLERLGGKVVTGKFPVLDKTLTGISDKITNRALRFGVKATVNAVQETAIENLQDLSTEVIQDITHALDQDIPDIEWSEVFDGYAHQTLTTFVAVLPLSVFGAGGGISTERRNQAFAKATDLELLAAGYSEAGVEAIRSASGDASLSEALEFAQEGFDAKSDSAKDATQELAESLNERKELEKKATEAGVLPRVVVREEGMEVVDPETEEVIGYAETSDDVIDIMKSHSNLLENAGVHRIKHLQSMIEGAQFTTFKDGAERDTTVELRLDEHLTVAQAAEESGATADRTREQLEIREKLGGGDGSVTQLVLGRSSTEFEGRQRKTLNKLQAGSSILDVVHEDAHGLFREAISTGRLTREETVDFFRNIDSALGDRAQNFLPEGEVSDVAIDEAVAEFAEVELLRTRKGEKSAIGSIVNSNLSAIAQIGTTSGKFKHFISAFKEYFKTALTRHLHIKKSISDGTLDEKDLDDFRAKLQGTTLQEEHDSNVRNDFEDLIEGDPFSVGSSETPFSIGQTKVTPTPESKAYPVKNGVVYGKASFSISAYHGTPHKVDKFSTENIGTGEGAQVYGWGLYFAGNKEVAESYREVLAMNKTHYQVDGEDLFTGSPDGSAEQMAIYELGGRGYDEALKTIEAWRDLDTDQEWVNDFSDNVEKYKGRVTTREDQNGNLYSVDLNVEEEDLLDWDKTLSEQSDKIKDVISEIRELRGEPFNRESDVPSSDFYRLLLAYDDVGSDPKRTSETLAFHGIKGIKYLDGNSRSEGEGSYNYVIFDDKDISITTENGEAVETSSGETSYSLGNSQIADAIIGDVSKRVRDPEARAQVFGKIIEKVRGLKRDTDELISVAGREVTRKAVVDPRTLKSLKKEAAFRQADAREQYEMEAWEQYGHVLNDESLAKIKEQPVHQALSGSSALRGRLMSRSQAMKNELFVNDNAGDYDDMGLVSPTVFGGSLAPDEAAKELFEDGVLPNDEISTLWKYLNAEAESVANRKEDLKEAKNLMREARTKSKEEAQEWLKEAQAKQERDHNPIARVRRSLATLDAIVTALPVELRGKVGGFAQIANLNSDEKRLEYLHKKIEKVDDVLDKWIADTTRKDIEKMFKRARIKKDTKGIPKAKLAADYTDEIRDIEDLSKMTATSKALKIEELQLEIDKAAEAGEVEAITEIETELSKVLTFGDLEHQSAQEAISSFENLSSLFNTGKILKEALEEEFSSELIALKEIVNNDVTGGKGSVNPDEAKRKQGKREANKVLHGMSKLHRMNLNFEWLLNAASRENKEAGTLQSETTKQLGRMVHKSTHEEKRANMATLKRYNSRMGEIFQTKGLRLSKAIDAHTKEADGTGVFVDYYEGGRKTIKKSLKANIVRRLLDQEIDSDAVGLSEKDVSLAIKEYKRMESEASSGVVKDNRNINYEVEAKAEKVEKRLSQDQALNISMLWLQEDLQASMQEEGFTQSTMDQIEEFLSDESKQVRDFLRAEYDQNYHELNAVFKVMNGTNLPQNKNYSPAVRKADGVAKDLQIDSAGTSAMSTSPNFLISRVKNFAQIDQTVGALSLYMGHMNQSQHYISWAKPVKMLRSVFGSKEVKANVEAYAGQDLLTGINEKIEWFADGGNRKASHYRALDKMRTTFTYASLAYNWGVGVKQLTSLPAYAWDMGYKDFAKYSAEFAKNPGENMKFIWELEYTQTRFKEGYERDVIEGLKGGGTLSEDLLQKGMLVGKVGDVVPVMAGGWISYKRALDKALSEGMSKEKAHEEAVMTFEMSTDRAQQAGDLKDFSTFQGGGSLFKLFTMFKTSPTQYYRNVYESFLDAKAGKKGGKEEFANRLFIGQVLLPLTFQFASDFVSSIAGIAGDEDEFDGLDYIRAILLGPLNGLFIAGDAMELISSGLAGTKIWSEKLPILDPFEKVAKGTQSIYRGDFEKGVDEILRGAGKVAPSPITFYEIFRREYDKLDLDE